MSNFDLPEDELDISYEQDEEGRWIARIFHKPTSTIKISDYFWEQSDAFEQAVTELKELITERRKGLGKT